MRNRCSECGTELNPDRICEDGGYAWCTDCQRLVAPTVSIEQIEECSREIRRTWSAYKRKKRSGMSTDAMEVLKCFRVTDHMVRRGRIAGK